MQIRPQTSSNHFMLSAALVNQIRHSILFMQPIRNSCFRFPALSTGCTMLLLVLCVAVVRQNDYFTCLVSFTFQTVATNCFDNFVLSITVPLWEDMLFIKI